MKIAYRIYVLLCIGGGMILQHGKPHADYLLGFVYGLVGSWLVPGLLLEFLLRQTHNMPLVFGGSFAFWVIVGLLRKALRAKHNGRTPGQGLAVAASPYSVLPDLPAGFGYYSKPTTQTTRIVRYIEED